MDEWQQALNEAVKRLRAWEDRWDDRETPVADEATQRALIALTERLQDNFPFFHPRYAGQMLKPPHPAAWVAQAVTSLINPNNHALDGGPATAQMEKEAIGELKRLFGWPKEALGHLTTGGTMANLEALWVARELHPTRGVAYGRNAHYTHERVCRVLGIQGHAVPCDASGRMDLESLDQLLDTEPIGTIVVTPGTTGLGAVDPVHKVVQRAHARGIRVHADAAYGGFFRLLAERNPPAVDAAPFLALAKVDSLVVDPHKHGLQPYGCGAVFFKDPTVGRFHAHDSPYTYFSSDELHLGELTLECSRPGAAAAALWTTMRAVPFRPHEGLGELLAAGRRGALAWAEALQQDAKLRLLLEPATDILCFGARSPRQASELSAQSQRLFEETGRAEPGQDLHLAMIRLGRDEVEPHWPELAWDQDTVTLLRSVVMKPQHENWWPRLHEAVRSHVR
ncbi:MAG: aminotransferase class V-fold PLP-dependent enzyme [Myxococcota bacterium]